jgi:hypothetical protein
LLTQVTFCPPSNDVYEMFAAQQALLRKEKLFVTAERQAIRDL